MLADTLVIICISVFTAFLGEGITWLLVYRTDKYKKLQAEVDKHSKKCELQRSGWVCRRNVSRFSPVTLIFDGRVVCKLPFTPISWLYGMSHRNLHGNDFTDCSFIFLYIICTMSIRQNVQKMLGFSPSRAANQNAYGSSN
ncbi:unnamed protein product [Taenia asiatica]|uniref:Calcium load-activated calcium channel n=1 Tax=Taenia asiatica TaxID=60517 RepID=A0A0R3VVJ4_TAEAS|nr:unnamed protein product [Taenia asiatica]